MAYGDSAAASLAAINAAIAAILSGAQEYYIGSRRVRRADLRTLFDQQRVLEAAAARESGGVPMFSVVQPERPT